MFKKILAMMLAVMTVFSLSSPVFAVETVDNTFNNFVPEPGNTAPDNWYDPYCYESDGRINKYCLSQGYTTAVAMYCPKHKKIFTIMNMGRKMGEYGVEFTRPYEVKCKDWAIYIEYDNSTTILDIYTQWFCPYCGKYESAYYTDEESYNQNSAIFSHVPITSIVYGFQCEQCNSFRAKNNYASEVNDINSLQFNASSQHYNSRGKIETVDVNTVKLYRFLTETQRNAEYSFIFKETEKDFGDGKDGRVEDLKESEAFANTYVGWNSPDNPYKKATFWDKIVEFFQSIIKFFASFFK